MKATDMENRNNNFPVRPSVCVCVYVRGVGWLLTLKWVILVVVVAYRMHGMPEPGPGPGMCPNMPSGQLQWPVAAGDFRDCAPMGSGAPIRCGFGQRALVGGEIWQAN